MNVAENNAVRNPETKPADKPAPRSTDKPGTKPDLIRQSLDQLIADLKANIVSAASSGDSFDKAERITLRSVLEIGLQTLQLFIAMQGDGDLGAEIETADGQRLDRSDRPQATTLRSIFGRHDFKQYTYSPGEKRAIARRPVSARMSLPESRWSFLLQEFSQMLGVDQAWDQAMKNLGQIFGGKFSVDTAERINGRMGESAGAFLADLPKPDPDSEAKLLVASADCKGVPLVKEDSPKIAAFETAKKNPGNRRMATAASVYSVEPHVRTPEDITAALFRDERDPEAEAADRQRPKPQNKNTTAHFPEQSDDGQGKAVAISGIHVAMAWIMGQLDMRRRAGQVLVVLMDGQASLWETLKLHLDFGARTVAVLDILHALSYVWKAAGLFETSEAARKQFTRERLLRILRGEVRGVIQGLRALGTRRGLKGEKLKSLHKICNYLEHNADRMRYHEYLRRGYPIASGVIEGACRHLIKDRMERSGMRWTLEGARRMLNTRAAYQSDHWRKFLDWNMQAEITRTHKHRDLLGNYTPITLAC